MALGLPLGLADPPQALLPSERVAMMLAATYLLLAEAAKQMFYRRRAAGGTPPAQLRSHLPLIQRS